MCRLLLVQAKTPFDPVVYLEPFAAACRKSPEYQGHGWGLMHIRAGTGQRDQYKNIGPIWEDELGQFGPATVLLAHARSAFRDEDIVLTNNMPFVFGSWSFVFNGELRGVRMRAEGRTGAARIWHLICRAHTTSKLPMEEVVSRTVQLLVQRCAYVRAINMLLTDGIDTVVHSTFNESSDYFTLHRFRTADNHLTVTSSEPFDLPSHPNGSGANGWHPIRNRSTLVW